MSKTTILLADDQQAITDNLAPFLERSGFNVQAASAGDSDVFTHPGGERSICTWAIRKGSKNTYRVISCIIDADGRNMETTRKLS